MPHPLQTKLAELVDLLIPLANQEGLAPLNIPGFSVVKASQTNTTPIRQPSSRGLCFVVQGAKRVAFGDKIYEYKAGSLAIYSSDNQAASNILSATQQEPYLCLVMEIEPQLLAELSLKVFPRGVPSLKSTLPIHILQSDEAILDCAIRVVKLTQQPEKMEYFVPLIVQEILLHLLTSTIGQQIAQIGAKDSNMYRISRAISWLREHYDETIKVEDLADKANMSTSAFFQHFKAVTSMSPLQYQKSLRLHHARQMMLNQMLDVNTASAQVGYVSVSQFSREYSRHFGFSPTKDIANIRDFNPAELISTD